MVDHHAKQNIAYGFHAGYNLTNGSNYVDIGNVGVAGESGAIRIGSSSTQSAKVYPELVIRDENGRIDGVL
jgi:hypothetical protein